MAISLALYEKLNNGRKIEWKANGNWLKFSFWDAEISFNVYTFRCTDDICIIMLIAIVVMLIQPPRQRLVTFSCFSSGEQNHRYFRIGKAENGGKHVPRKRLFFTILSTSVEHLFYFWYFVASIITIIIIMLWQS
jgi:hypothetical protein